jgi:A/G-specific adenine glycosylase
VVSEFMLQQTQVTTVLPYFDRWLRELPDFKALAAFAEIPVFTGELFQVI